MQSQSRWYQLSLRIDELRADEHHRLCELQWLSPYGQRVSI